MIRNDDMYPTLCPALNLEKPCLKLNPANTVINIATTNKML
ncbi:MULTISPECIES: hypothetical protein [Sulfurisphaera]|nr:hypothetical protein [Sulfurisphaera tokodaii]